MASPIGIVACSFGRRVNEPGPANAQLGQALLDLFDDLYATDGVPPGTVIVSQWEIVRYLERPAIDSAGIVDRIVTREDATFRETGGRTYLSTNDVLEVAEQVFREHGVERVIVVAKPFLHLALTRAMMRGRGFSVSKHPMPRIGFNNDPDELQW